VVRGAEEEAPGVVEEVPEVAEAEVGEQKGEIRNNRNSDED
jgi:hypothetical protein